MPNLIQAMRPEVNKTFSVPGFRIRTDSTPAWAEVVVATSPDLLFDPDARERRTLANFYTSRSKGLLPIPRGEAIYLLPPDVMARFVGQERLYYAVAIYRQPEARDPQIMRLPSEMVPYIRISSNYRGNAVGILNMPNRRGGLAGNGYANGNQQVLDWGGDAVPAGETVPVRAPERGTGNGQANGGRANGSSAARMDDTSREVGAELAAEEQAYSDGFDAEFWTQAQNYMPDTIAMAQQQSGAVAIGGVILGATISRIASNEGDVSWELDQLEGLKHPNDNPDNQGSDPFTTSTINVPGPVSGGLIDDITADFEVRFQHNGRSLGNVQITNTRTNDAVGWALHVKASIMNDAAVHNGRAAVDVQFHYRFTRSIGSDVIGIRDLKLFADGTFNDNFRWTQSSTLALQQNANHFDGAAVERMRQAFTSIAQQGASQNGTSVAQAGLRQLYGSLLVDANGSNRNLGSTMRETMAALQEYSLAGVAQDFEFTDSSGAVTKGAVRPEALNRSVEGWLSSQAKSSQMPGWHVFGMSILDGYHGVILALNFAGNGEQGAQLYWADQIYGGWDDVTNKLDERIVGQTQTWWDPLPEDRKARTRVSVWPLYPDTASTALALEGELDDIEGYSEEPEGVPQALSGNNTQTCIDSCSDGFCPVNTMTNASTANFTLAEFRCRDGTDVPEAFRGNVQMVMENLEVLRAELGNRPIHIRSGYRTCSYNCTLQGAASQSRHLCGQAADIHVEGYTPVDVHATIERLISEGRMRQGGLGLYNTFVHYDVRGTRARWDRRR